MLVPRVGLEPTHPEGYWILNPGSYANFSSMDSCPVQLCLNKCVPKCYPDGGVGGNHQYGGLLHLGNLTNTNKTILLLYLEQHLNFPPVFYIRN